MSSVFTGDAAPQGVPNFGDVSKLRLSVKFGKELSTSAQADSRAASIGGRRQHSSYGALFFFLRDGCGLSTIDGPAALLQR